MILLILILGLTLRVINLNQSFWWDEAINVVYARDNDLIFYLTNYMLGDFHPPGWFFILWIFTHIFGFSEIVARIPSVIFGVSTIFFTYLIGKEHSKKAGLIAATILAFNPLHVYYSQEARMYSLAAFSATFCFWALINLLKGKKFFSIYAFSVVLVLYSDYLVYFLLISQFIYVILLEKQKLFKFLSGVFLGAFFWLPWLAVFPSQLQTGQLTALGIPGWANVVGGFNVKDLVLVWVKLIIGRVSFDNKFIYLAVISSISTIYGLILFKAVKPLSKEVKLLLFWIVAPVVLAFLVSFYIPVLAYFRMIFILPGLSLLLAYGIEKLNRNYKKTFLGVVLITSSAFLSVYYLNPKFQREDWKGAVNFVITQDMENKLVLFEDNNVPAPFEYYYPCTHSKCIPFKAGLKNLPAEKASDLSDLNDLLLESKDVVYLFDYLVEISDPKRLLAKKLENLGFKFTNTYNFNGVGFVHEYSR